MNHYVHNKISGKSYVITEDYGAGSRYTIGVFVGSTSAAVIDSGWGVTGNLREYIRENITGKPVVCLLTHPHPDHMGASVQFDKVYMNPDDEAISVLAREKEKRLGDLGAKLAGSDLFKEMESEVTDCSGFSYEAISDGQLFDLGGISIQAISVPGHTPGSTVFYCGEEKIAFVGDTIGCRVTFLEENPDFRSYVHHVVNLIELVADGTIMYGGHSQLPMDKALLTDIVRACENILSGQTHPVKAELPPFMLAGLNGKTPWAEVVGDATVVYI